MAYIPVNMKFARQPSGAVSDCGPTLRVGVLSSLIVAAPLCRGASRTAIHPEAVSALHPPSL